MKAWDWIRRRKDPRVWAECSGHCGKLVLRENGECRKCRRKRIHMGMKKIKRIDRESARERATMEEA